MDIIIALVFVSVTLVAAGLVFFFSRLFEGDFEHGERLSLLPLQDDEGTIATGPELPDDKDSDVVLNGARKPAEPPESRTRAESSRTPAAGPSRPES